MTKLVFWTAAIACLVSSSIAHADKIYRTGRGATWDCKQDPIVSILHGNGKYTFTGACKSITLTGGNNTLTIGTTDSISITGAHNKVAIDTVDAINIVGSHNTVTYKSAAHGDKPSVSQIGTSRCDPPVSVTTRELHVGTGKGYLLTIIAASPAAPHQVDGQYRARADTTNYVLTDADVRRIQAERRRAQRDIEDRGHGLSPTSDAG